MYIKASQSCKLTEFVQLKMKLLVLVIAFVAVVQAELDRSNIEQNESNSPGSAHRLPKIIGGQIARPHQFPHQVALYIDEIRALCGGSLIRADVVLTAAHCVYKYNSLELITRLEVRAGAHYVLEYEPTQQVFYSADMADVTVHVHDYDLVWHWNDIALIILPRKFNIDGITVKTISLPKQSCPDSSTDYAIATISGWGMNTSVPSQSEVLRYVSGPITSNAVCTLYFNNGIRDTQLCFPGGDVISGCEGDSGGALIISTSDGGIKQIGVNSYVSDLGCQASYPTVCTRVSCYVDWINSKIN